MIRGHPGTNMLISNKCIPLNSSKPDKLNSVQTTTKHWMQTGTTQMHVYSMRSI